MYSTRMCVCGHLVSRGFFCAVHYVKRGFTIGDAEGEENRFANR